jgi:hypothetical protein
MSKAQAFGMLDNVTSMHAHYWESEKLKVDWLNPKGPEGEDIPIAIDDWWKMFTSLPDPKKFMESYNECFKKGANIDLFENQETKDFIDLFCTHPKALRKAWYAKLASRPRTMVHGDLRPENLFSGKEEPLKFVAIDW